MMGPPSRTKGLCSVPLPMLTSMLNVCTQHAVSDVCCTL